MPSGFPRPPSIAPSKAPGSGVERSPSLSAPCALILKLFEGQRGTVHLARLTKGEEAGRFVLLRELKAPEAAQLASDIDLARSIAHPQLLKLLGIVRSDDHVYLASEYVPGVALTEVRGALRKQRSTLELPVAVRIVRDALAASLTARELLHDAAGIDATSAFHPDAIWLAEFGETLLSPVPTEVRDASRTPYSSSAADTAPGLLMELITGLSPARLLGEGLAAHLPPALADVLTRSLARHAAAGNDSEALLLSALNELPAELCGSEQEVEQELVRVVGPRLHSRRLLVAVDQERDGELGADDATVITRLAKVERAFDADEPTRNIRLSSPVRETDPDGQTELFSSSRPPASGGYVEPEVSLRLPSLPPQWAAQLLEQTQLSRQTQSAAPPAPVKSKRAALYVLSLAALLAVLAALAAALR
jgi:hypothetical protein